MPDEPTLPEPDPPPPQDVAASDAAPPDPVPTATGPIPTNAASAGPVPPAPAVVGAQQVALGVMVFLAALLLLLGATRILERGGIGAGASPSVATASSPGPASPGPSTSASGGPSPTAAGSAVPGGSAVPSGSTTPGQSSTPGVDPVLVGAGDIGDCGTNGDEATAALLDAIDGTVYTAGDNAYPSGTAVDFQKCYDQSWGRHKARTRAAVGNHDWESQGLAGYLAYFGAAGEGLGGTSWYSYDLATWHVIVLDSDCDKVGCGADTPQGTWLAADLAASHATCTMAIFHHPRFSSGEHGNDPVVDAFWRPLYAAGVDVIVNGHDHDYERFAPQDPDGKVDTNRGIREFVVGTGGTTLRGFQKTVANSEVRLSNSWGVLKFTLHDGSYDVEFIAAGNDFRDRGTAEKCH
jgi:hypothetical protein